MSQADARACPVLLDNRAILSSASELDSVRYNPALLFCILLGFLGIHRFYLGKIGTGVLMALTLGGLGVWNLVDLILIAVGSFRDTENKRVFRWLEPGSF
jgi:TM2 domain